MAATDAGEPNIYAPLEAEAIAAPEITRTKVEQHPENDEQDTATAAADTAPAYNDHQPAAEPEEIDIHEQVRRAVEEARAELDRNGSFVARDSARKEQEPSIISDSLDYTAGGEIDVHEQVRRAVEEARAELEASKSSNGAVASSLMDFHSDSSKVVESGDLDEWMANANPPTLVIENPSSRVELSRLRAPGSSRLGEQRQPHELPAPQRDDYHRRQPSAGGISPAQSDGIRFWL